MGVPCSKCCLKDREFRETGDVGQEADTLTTPRRRPHVHTETYEAVAIDWSNDVWSMSSPESYGTSDMTSQNVERNRSNRAIDWSNDVWSMSSPESYGTSDMTSQNVERNRLNRVSVNQRGEESNSRNEILALAHPNVFCWFDYFEENQFENVRKYFFKRTVHFCNEETDTVVIELVQSRDSVPLPSPFQDFGLPDIGGKFTLLGHEGTAMEYNMVDLIIDKENEQTREEIRYVKYYNTKLTTKRYEFPPYSTLTNEHRLLFHCKFGKGASGSPGLALQADGSVVVVTMLLCGYPDWYYDQNVDRNLLQQWPKEYCIEQGTDMISVGNKMQDENPVLYRELFPKSYNIPVPDIY